MNPVACDVLAIDLGSSCVKLGWFRSAGSCATKPPAGALAIAAPPLPMPDETFCVEHRGRDAAAWGAEIDSWLDENPVGGAADQSGAWCLVGSVNPHIAESLIARLRKRSWQRIQLLTVRDLPLAVHTTEPSRVGIDRVLDAVAVNRLRQPGTPAIIVDMGTAITVDLVSADGAFEGGAILAGPVLALSALHVGTASLPALDLAALAGPPAAVGKSTKDALMAGAYWGAVGAVRELVARTAAEVGGEPELYLTGGGAVGYASLLQLNGRPARYVPHLVLAGIRLVAEGLAP